MKLFLTDTSTNLSKTLMQQYNISEIPAKTCALGQIMYNLDKYINNFDEIYYFSSKENYDSIITISNKILSLHAGCHVTIINIDSGNLGKNNLVLKTILSLNKYNALETYGASVKHIQSINYNIVKENTDKLFN